MQQDLYSKRVVEERTRKWLEDAYWSALAGHGDPEKGVYDPAGRIQHLDSLAFQIVLRKLKIFRWLDRFDFESFIDIGSGFDHTPYLVRKRYGARSYYSDFAHSLNLPYGGAIHGKLDHAVTLNINRLPFADDSFDVVLSSEVLEHLVRPIEAVGELLRVTRKYLVMTSLEALSANRWERFLSHLRIDLAVPHVERNFFLLHELEDVFGADWHHENLWHDSCLPASQFVSIGEQVRAYAPIRDTETFATALCRALAIEDHRAGSMGILIVKTKPGAPIRPRSEALPLARWLVEQNAAAYADGYRLIQQLRDGTAELVAKDRPVVPELLALLRCPDCRGPLTQRPAALSCASCGSTFATEHGVPILYPKREDRRATEDDVSRLCGTDARRRRTLLRLMRRLRANEAAPGVMRRFLQRVDRALART